jgi:hypothetical protein
MATRESGRTGNPGHPGSRRTALEGSRTLQFAVQVTGLDIVLFRTWDDGLTLVVTGAAGRVSMSGVVVAAYCSLPMNYIGGRSAGVLNGVR